MSIYELTKLFRSNLFFFFVDFLKPIYSLCCGLIFSQSSLIFILYLQIVFLNEKLDHVLFKCISLSVVIKSIQYFNLKVIDLSKKVDV